MSVGLRELVTHFAGHGKVQSIVLRPVRRADAVFVPKANAEPGRGLVGDHRADIKRESLAARQRELTLIQHEHLPLIATWSGRNQVSALELRRNLVVSGINLMAAHSPFSDQIIHLHIGADVLLEITGSCPPCSRMEAVLGHGGYSAMRGHGGVTARILRGGMICAGDTVTLAPAR